MFLNLILAHLLGLRHLFWGKSMLCTQVPCLFVCLFVYFTIYLFEKKKERETGGGEAGGERVLNRLPAEQGLISGP